jgi:hypothetical protein
VRLPEKWQLVRFSKIGSYEQPYTVTGGVKLTGSEQAPKYICKDRVIGTWKVSELSGEIRNDCSQGKLKTDRKCP